MEPQEMGEHPFLFQIWDLTAWSITANEGTIFLFSVTQSVQIDMKINSPKDKVIFQDQLLSSSASHPLAGCFHFYYYSPQILRF